MPATTSINAYPGRFASNSNPALRTASVTITTGEPRLLIFTITKFNTPAR